MNQAAIEARARGTNIVIDTFYGDGGKGKLVDLLSAYAYMVIRYGGGDNAGHTVKNARGEFKMHIMPSGIFNPGTINVLADGVVLNPWSLISEMTALRQAGIDISHENLLISEKAQLILPWHKLRDGKSEQARGGRRIGTTGKGIGPAYSDRVAREGLRVGDLLNADLEKMVIEELNWQEKLIRAMDGEPLVSELFTVKFWRNKPVQHLRDMIRGMLRSGHLDQKQIIKDLYLAQEMLAPMITNTVSVIRKAVDDKRNVLGEGAQGSLLDIDHGSYPYVTSSNPGRVGFERATTVDPKDIANVYGVTKAFATRVGKGPMPTELFAGQERDELLQLNTPWAEVGTTTGRLRRVGWFDAVQAAWGADFGGATSICVTKIDVLDNLAKIPVCVGYKIGGGPVRTDIRGITTRELQQAEPVYEVMPGWQSSTRGITDYELFPQQAKDYLTRISDLTGLPLSFISTGPARDQTVVL